MENKQPLQEEFGAQVDILEIDRKCYKDPVFSKLYLLAYLKQHGREMKKIYLIRKNPVIKKYLLDLHHFIENYEIN